MTFKHLLVAAILLACLNAQLEDIARCNGTFTEDINQLLIECFDDAGSLVSSNEKYFEFKLENFCDDKSYDELITDLNNMTLPESITEDMTINCCDYYQKGQGYEFTLCDNDLGAFIIEDKKSGPQHEAFLNMTQDFELMDWDWTALLALIDEYCATKATGAVPPDVVNIPAETNDTTLEAVWSMLPITQWSDWLTQMPNTTNFDEWNKEELKLWLGIYDTVINAYNLYISTLDVPEGETAPEVVPQVSWSPDYDADEITVTDILDSLEQSGQFQNFQDFYLNFYGDDDAIIKTMDEQAAVNVDETPNLELLDNSTIPVGLEKIVEWITLNTDKEVRYRCNLCVNKSVPNKPIEIDNMVPTVGNVSKPVVLVPEEYKLAKDCKFSNEDDLRNEVCCDDKDNNVCVMLEDVNNFMVDDAEALCANALTIHKDCEEKEDRAADVAKCFREDLFDQFEKDNHEKIYGLFFFDQTLVDELFEICNADEEFDVTRNELRAGFKFDFGELE